MYAVANEGLNYVKLGPNFTNFIFYIDLIGYCILEIFQLVNFFLGEKYFSHICYLQKRMCKTIGPWWIPLYKSMIFHAHWIWYVMMIVVNSCISNYVLLNWYINGQVNCYMSFCTTRRRDPDIVDKAMDLLHLLSLRVPASYVQILDPLFIYLN